MRLFIFGTILLIASCTTINVTSDGNVVIDAHKQIKADTDTGL